MCRRTETALVSGCSPAAHKHAGAALVKDGERPPLTLM